MRNYSESLGLDISKSHFDAVLHQKKLHRQFDNNQSGFKALNRWIKDLNYSWKDILVCFENTGYYSLDIAYFLSNHDVERNYRLCTSVKGIGPVLATELILHTHNFTCFNSWRKFAAYSGTVPYPYQSGSSINWRAKIHPFCDKRLKSLLTMGAICAMKLKQYYKKRIEEGKPKMSVINIIRNKLIARVFAVIKRGTPYVMLDKYAA